MSERELAVLLGGIESGRLTQDQHGRPRFKVSARNAFALVSHVGEDCAGAVQIVRPERIDAMAKGRTASIEWLTDADLAERLRTLHVDPGAWRAPGDLGQLTLAGAQPKTALLFEKGRWGVPSGHTPTTHILKPPSASLDGFVENEHFCLELAAAVGLTTAKSRVMRFGEEIAIVIERYDRICVAAGWTRIHQEDFCQAMGIAPAKKYQSEGGPGARSVAEFLQLHSSSPEEDAETFVAALGLNWLLAATDGHAKNYSLVAAPAGCVRLAPLYDIASVLPYAQFDLTRVKLAMRVADKYRLREIGRREWERLSSDMKVDADEFIGKLVQVAEALPDLIADTTRSAIAAGLEHAVIQLLNTRLTERARICLGKLVGRMR